MDKLFIFMEEYWPEIFGCAEKMTNMKYGTIIHPMVVFTISMHALNTYIGLSLMPLTSKTGLLCITGIKLLCIRLDRAPQQEACQKNHLQHYNCLPPMQIRLSYTVFVWLPNSTFRYQIPDNVAIVSNVSAIPSLHSRNAAPNITLMSWDKARPLSN